MSKMNKAIRIEPNGLVFLILFLLYPKGIFEFNAKSALGSIT
jgi:hypothetical protein